MTGLRVVVTGGRHYVDAENVHATLDQYPLDVICQGGAEGADALARDYARDLGIQLVTYDAHWNRHGRAAGPLRNERMLADFRPDLVIAFPGGPGTAHMTGIARATGYTVVEIPVRTS